MNITRIARICRPASAALLATLALCCSGLAQAAPAEPTDRIIVQWRSASQNVGDAQFDSQVRASGRRAGVALRAHHALGGNLHVLQLDASSQGAALDQILATLRSDPQVALAVPDRRVRTHLTTPGDSLYAKQWYLQAQEIAAIRANSAWDFTKGIGAVSGTPVVVAVLDTGVRFDHPDLRRAASGGKLLPGYDFVSADKPGNFTSANDGDGWDTDPSDPGDFISAADLANPVYAGKKCGAGTNNDQPTSSSWHGTRVSGMIGADTNNGVGVAGAAYNVRILPVRVLGKCGGYDSDVIAGMYWAAGLSIPPPLLAGTPATNSNPAQVINLSLGGVGSCPAAYNAVIQDLTNKGIVVVASAGNEGGPVDAPANCAGVLGVGGLRQIGTKVGYSNLGTEVGISAPAGNCVLIGAGDPCLFSLDTTTDSGSTIPVGPTYTDQYRNNVGTSFSAPLAAAAAGLVMAANPVLSASQVIARLKVSARAFPTTSTTTPAPPACHLPVDSKDIQGSECICAAGICGAGMLDVGAAVALAAKPTAVATGASAVIAGQSAALDASGSTAVAGHKVVTYVWSVVSSPAGATATLSNGSSAKASVVMSQAGSYTLRVTITDDYALTDAADLTLTASAAPAPSTGGSSSSSNNSGGGGRFSSWLLLLLTGLIVLRSWRSLRYGNSSWT
ncbi:MAG: S8 family serine peptidase [Proteobacteria bacterium]|nr:S8 family serine peptidase [Pseudomonadota bacterium]